MPVGRRFISYLVTPSYQLRKCGSSGDAAGVKRQLVVQPAPHVIFQAAAKLAGFDQAEIAEHIHKSPATVSRYLSGERFPRDFDLARLCALLGLDAALIRGFHDLEGFALANPGTVAARPQEELDEAVRRALPNRPQNWSKDPVWARHIEDALSVENVMAASEATRTSLPVAPSNAPPRRLPTSPGRWRQIEDTQLAWEFQAAAAAGTADSVLDLAADRMAASPADDDAPLRERVARAIAEAAEAVAFYGKKS